MKKTKKTKITDLPIRRRGGITLFSEFNPPPEKELEKIPVKGYVTPRSSNINQFKFSFLVENGEYIIRNETETSDESNSDDSEDSDVVDYIVDTDPRAYEKEEHSEVDTNQTEEEKEETIVTDENEEESVVVDYEKEEPTKVVDFEIDSNPSIDDENEEKTEIVDYVVENNSSTFEKDQDSDTSSTDENEEKTEVVDYVDVVENNSSNFEEDDQESDNSEEKDQEEWINNNEEKDPLFIENVVKNEKYTPSKKEGDKIFDDPRIRSIKKGNKSRSEGNFFGESKNPFEKTSSGKRISEIDQLTHKMEQNILKEEEKEAKKAMKQKKKQEEFEKRMKSIDEMEIGEMTSDDGTESTTSSVGSLARKQSIKKLNEIIRTESGRTINKPKKEEKIIKIEPIKKETKVVAESKEKEVEDLESQIKKESYFSRFKKKHAIKKRLFERNYRKSFLLIFNSISFIGILYNCGSVSYRIGYETYTHWVLKIFDIIFDNLFLLTILLHFFTKPYDFEDTQWKYILKYLLNFNTIPKIFYVFVPIDWPLIGYINAWMRINKLTGIFLLDEMLKPVEDKLEMYFNMIYFRVVKYSLLMVIIIHIFSCFWFYIAKAFPSDFGNFIIPGNLHEPLLYEVLLQPPEREVNQFAYSFIHLKQYLGSLYYGSFYIVGFAAPFPQDLVQSAYSCLAVLFGAGLFATLIGTVSSILNSLGRTQQMFNEKMGQITKFLKEKNVNKAIVKKITVYYDMLERRGRGMVNSEIIFNDLDIALKRKVNKSLHKDLVKKVQIFQKCELITNGLFIEDVCNYLKYILLLKGFTIVRHGEIGKTMYFIGKGEVDIISKDGVKWATLGRGDFFGEIALFLKKKRTANVVAKTNCELYELGLDDLERILQIHNQCKILFYKEARFRYKELKQKERQLKKIDALKNRGTRRKKKDVSTIRSGSTAGDQRVRRVRKSDKTTPTTPTTLNTPKTSITSLTKTGSSNNSSPSTPKNRSSKFERKDTEEIIKRIRKRSTVSKRKGDRSSKLVFRKRRTGNTNMEKKRERRNGSLNLSGSESAF